MRPDRPVPLWELEEQAVLRRLAQPGFRVGLPGARPAAAGAETVAGRPGRLGGRLRYWKMPIPD